MYTPNVADDQVGFFAEQSKHIWKALEVRHPTDQRLEVA
jgi:hypothetical protein